MTKTAQGYDAIYIEKLVLECILWVSRLKRKQKMFAKIYVLNNFIMLLSVFRANKNYVKITKPGEWVRNELIT